MPAEPRHLSRRERQILDILFRKQKASASEVRKAMADPPSYSAVRALLRILEEKGHARHERDGARYVFTPVVKREMAQKSAVRHLLATFFENSASQAVAALLDVSARRLSDEELDRISQLIGDARKPGRS